MTSSRPQHLSLPQRHVNTEYLSDETSDEYAAEPPVDLRTQSLRAVARPGEDAKAESTPTAPATAELDTTLGDDEDRAGTAPHDEPNYSDPETEAEATGPIPTATSRATPTPQSPRGPVSGQYRDSESATAYPEYGPAHPRTQTGYPMPQGVGYDPTGYGTRPDPDPRARVTGGGAYGPGAAEFLRGNVDVTSDPAEWGWRGRVNAAFNMHLRPKPDSDEVAFRESIEHIRQSIPGISRIAVLNIKGGQGKTPTALMLSNTLGKYRGGGVVAWDSNESKGTLAMRAAVGAPDPRNEPTVWDVLEVADQLCSPSAQAGALDYFLRRQPTQDEILASDSSSKRMAAIGWDECEAIMAVLRRHRSMVIIDTGNDDLKPNWRWATENADQLVIPMTYRKDAALAVAKMLDGLLARDLQHLVASAIVVMAATPGANVDIAEDLRDQLRTTGVHRFVDVPYEPQFDGVGEPIRYDRLNAATIRAYTHLTAQVADALAATRVNAPSRELEVEYVPAAIARPAEHDVRGTRSGRPRIAAQLGGDPYGFPPHAHVESGYPPHAGFTHNPNPYHR